MTTYFQTPSVGKVGHATLMQITSTSTLTNMALAATEAFSATQRLNIDLTARTYVCMSGWVTTTGAAGSKLYLQYALPADQTTWATLISKASGLALDTVSSTVLQITPYVVIPAAARTSVVVRIMGEDGDGAADPVVRAIEMSYK